MTTAALYVHPDAFDTTGQRLMGRHSAGESFLRGLLRHGAKNGFYAFNPAGLPQSKLDGLIERIQPGAPPANWIGPRQLARLAEPGCLYVPSPEIPRLAWMRQPFGDDRYSLCGITHTTASHAAMDIFADMVSAPLQPWDGLICTSGAVRASVDLQLDATRDYMRRRLGATRYPLPQLITIPLGVNVSDFTPSDEHRANWRARLDIPHDAIVALYVGRFHPNAKMNPAVMALALEAAAVRTGKPLYWVVSGWGPSDAFTETYHREVRRLCPSVHYREVDGRPADTRFSIWSAADFFISFSDNIQETFGLTPVEAMAAGLPCVVSDWDGYKDTVCHGEDGFRIRTYFPREGLGGDLAYAHANQGLPYEVYLAATAQMTAIDNQAATEAITALIEQPDLRARMGVSARRRAQEVFDWSVIIPRYEAFWGDLAARRAAAKRDLGAAKLRPRENPRRLDPFKLFKSYPTEVIGPESRFALVSGMTWEDAKLRLAHPYAQIARQHLLSEPDCEAIVRFLASRPSATVGELLKPGPASSAPFVERGLLWLAKFGILRVLAADEESPSPRR